MSECGQSMTPLCDRVDGLINSRDYKPWRDLAYILERDGYQNRMDAAHDARRLIDDKMKMFERIAKLESSLAEAVAALKEHLEAHEAQFPAAEEGQMAQDAWAMRRDDADEAARAIIAKHSG